MPLYGPSYSPASFQKAMIFIDGTNLFYRLEAAKLKVPTLMNLFEPSVVVEQRQIERIYLYTVEQQFAKAKAFHGESFCDGIRVVFGTGVLKRDGNVKEKGVDALLVADLVYHAAMKNCEYVIVVTSDTDFVFALRRVEDFGCKTAVLGICCDVPQTLRLGCDQYIYFDEKYMLDNKIAVPA